MFDVLESFPNLGRKGEVEGTRELTVSRTEYRIVYSPSHLCRQSDTVQLGGFNQSVSEGSDLAAGL